MPSISTKAESRTGRSRSHVPAGVPRPGDGRIRRRGSALLAVLWLSAALSAIAFSLANTVRGEVERTGTAIDGVRCYYLATGALERGLLYMQWGEDAPPAPDGSPRYFAAWVRQFRFSFPSGLAIVEIIPESSKQPDHARRGTGG